MLVHDIGDGIDRVFIYADSPNNTIKLKNIRNKIIDNHMILVVGGAGSGKSVLAETMAWEYYLHDHKIIYLSNKPMSEFDSAYAMFPPKQSYHLDILRAMSVKPLSQPALGNLVQLIHPITFKAPSNKNPAIDWFGFSVKKISDEGFASILVGDVDKETVRICSNTNKKLKSSENMWDMLYKIFENIDKDKNKFSKDPNDLYIPVKQMGSKKTIERIRDSFKNFRTNMFLLPDNHPRVIDMEKILNDNKRMTVVCTKWGLTQREKYFVIIQLLKEIEQTLKDNKVKHPLVIIMEEVKILLPKSNKVSYEKELSNLLRNLLSTIRTAGKGTTVVSTTQAAWDIDQKFANSNTINFYFRLNKQDKTHLIKDLYTKSTMIEGLNELKRGQFTWWEKNEDDGIFSGYDANVPPFAHAEERDDFFDNYKKHYKTEMVNYKKFYTDLKKEREQIEKVMRKRIKEMEKKNNEKKESKSKRSTAKSDVEKTKKFKESVVVKDYVEKTKSDLYKRCYEMKKEKPLLSWVKLGEVFGKKDMTVKKWAVKHAKLVHDEDFLGKCGIKT